ncbi:MAG TPA: DUF1772 domain-containing protein [Terracidiphilus sp.]|jgi:uncharacterized membrane protein
MLRTLDIITTGCIGLMIGTELAVAVFIDPILWKLENPVQLTATRLFAKRLGTAMPFWYIASFVLLIAETIVRRHESGAALLAIASVIWATVIVLTILFLVPINNRLAQLGSTSVAEVARQQHRKWDRMHRYRVAALGAAMFCFLLSTSM